MIQDIFPTFSTQEAPLAYYRVDRMLLSPRHWKACNLAFQLQWRPVKFDAANATQVPDNRRGVYSFLVKPDIASHADVAYLIYVGKVERQFFRARFLQYVGHFKKGENSNWYHVASFLHKWQGHLWFYWAEIPQQNQIDATETTLISSFLPPGNHKFKGAVKKEVNLVFS